MRINEHKYLTYFLLIFLSTATPFLLLHIYGSQYEVYPAIILPAGAGKISTSQNEFSYHIIELYGIDTIHGTEKKIDIKDFIQPLPLRNLSSLTNNNFFLSCKEAKFWYAKKLFYQGCLDSVFIERKVLMNTKNSEIKVLSEEIHVLTK